MVSYTNQDTESKFGLPNTIAATSNVLKERTSVKKIAGNKTKTSSKTRKVASQPRSSGSNVNRRTSTNVTNKTNRLPSKKVSETTLRTTSGRSSHRIDESSQTDHISSTLPGSTTLDAAVQATPPRTVHQSTSKPSKSMTMAASVYNNPLVRTGKPPRHPSRIEVAPKQSSKSITRLRSRSAPVSRPGESLSANILMDLSQSDDKGSREFYRAIPSPSTTFGKSRR